LHINSKILTRAFDQYTVLYTTPRVIFIHQRTDEGQIVEAPFVFGCLTTNFFSFVQKSSDLRQFESAQKFSQNLSIQNFHGA
jgi:hypothetical protein